MAGRPAAACQPTSPTACSTRCRALWACRRCRSSPRSTAGMRACARLGSPLQRVGGALADTLSLAGQIPHRALSWPDPTSCVVLARSHIVRCPGCPARPGPTGRAILP
eukprot:362446-Chlamydomonas_euryale.AAC.1